MVCSLRAWCWHTGLENPRGSRLRQAGTCVTSAGERLQVTVTMSKQGTLGLPIRENQVRGGRGGHAEAAPGGAGGVGGPSSRRRDSGGSCPSVWDADQHTTDQRPGHSRPLLLTTLRLKANIKALVSSMSGDSPLPGSQRAVFLLCPHGVEGAGASGSSF